jgi:hypothetical protein
LGTQAWNVGLLVALALLWRAAGTCEERRAMTPGFAERAAEAEARVARAPDDADALAALADAYTEAQAPGVAVALVDGAPRALREHPACSHAQARALVEAGQASRALDAERRALEACGARGPGVCSLRLLATAARRVSVLELLVADGVEDVRANPEALLQAYRATTRDAALAIR